ncbi:AMP-binding protein [Streptomyces sp. NPDC059629]|uniref:AMP-binding protein n=1 Tax=Streptomyces sp. NPDC059629 TaxID=3346889 RepID=UPI0036A26706
MNVRKYGTVVDFLLEHGAKSPERVAIALVDGREATFGELWRRVLGTAGEISEMGLPPSSRIALWFSEGEWIDYAVAYFATLLAGATAVVLPTDARAQALRLICRDLGTGLVLSSAECPFPHADMKTLFVSGDDRTTADLPADKPSFPAVGPSASADVVFTSGSTGTPKGVSATHATLLEIAKDYRSRRGAAVVAHGVSHSTAIGTRQLLLSAVARGTTMAACVPFEARTFLTTAGARSVPVAVVPAATGRSLVRALKGDPALRPGGLKMLRLISDHLRPDVHRDLAACLPGVRVVNAYGLTEAGDAHLVVTEEDCHLGPGGRPAPGTEAAIMSESGDWLPPGEEGYICLRDRKTTLTYATDPLGTAGTWRDGWTLTGDRGRLDASGRILLTGRDHGLVGVGGRTVSLAVVKNALESLPGVEAAAVVTLPHPTLGHTLAAVVETSDGTTGEALTSPLADLLPSHAVPSPLVATDAMPLSRNGKPHQDAVLRIIRKRLSASSRPCETPTEQLVAALWERVLGLEDTPVADANFFQLGGDSLAAVEVAVELENELGVELPMNTFFMAPTAGGLAGALDELRQRP